MLDWARINELKNDIGEEEFVSLSELFLDEVATKLDDVRAAPDQIQADDMHFLKGCAANLGFDTFQKLCHKAETDPQSADLSEMQRVFDGSKTLLCAGEPGA